jgi:hypothetical protein
LCKKKKDHNNTATLRAIRSETRTPANCPPAKKKKKKKKGAKRKILADLVGCKDREEEGLEVERQVGATATATATATAPHHEHVWTYLIFEIEPGLSSPIVPEGVPIII